MKQTKATCGQNANHSLYNYTYIYEVISKMRFISSKNTWPDWHLSRL